MYNGGSGRENTGTGGSGSAAGSTKGGSSSKNKKKAASGGGRNGEDLDADEEKPPVKRLKITYSRDQ